MQLEVHRGRRASLVKRFKLMLYMYCVKIDRNEVRIMKPEKYMSYPHAAF